METIEIKYNRKKMVLLLLLCLAFSFLCWNLVSDPERYTSYRYKGPGFIFFTGLLGLIFLGGGNFILLKMLFRKNPALIIDERGITDYTTLVSFGLIHWEDIISINVKSNRFISVRVKNKKKYIKLSESPWQSYLMRLNLKYYKTSIDINLSALQIKHDELAQIILEAFKIYKKQ